MRYPKVNDKKLGDDIERIRVIRNKLSHKDISEAKMAHLAHIMKEVNQICNRFEIMFPHLDCKKTFAEQIDSQLYDHRTNIKCVKCKANCCVCKIECNNQKSLSDYVNVCINYSDFVELLSCSGYSMLTANQQVSAFINWSLPIKIISISIFISMSVIYHRLWYMYVILKQKDVMKQKDIVKVLILLPCLPSMFNYDVNTFIMWVALTATYFLKIFIIFSDRTMDVRIQLCMNVLSLGMSIYNIYFLFTSIIKQGTLLIVLTLFSHVILPRLIYLTASNFFSYLWYRIKNLSGNRYFIISNNSFYKPCSKEGDILLYAFQRYGTICYNYDVGFATFAVSTLFPCVSLFGLVLLIVRLNLGTFEICIYSALYSICIYSMFIAIDVTFSWLKSQWNNLRP